MTLQAALATAVALKPPALVAAAAAASRAVAL
jgi:hypothetical protein